MNMVRLPTSPLPPHHQEAEETVIGAVLVHQRCFEDVRFLAPGDFYHPALGAIFEAMRELDAQSKPIDVLTVAEQMRSMDTFNKLRAFNGAEFLDDLTGRIVSFENVAYHARIVAEKATARRLVEACRQITARGYGDYGDLDDLVAYAQRAVEEARDRSLPAAPAVRTLTTADVLRSSDFNRPRRTIPTGIEELDRLIGGGLKSRQLAVIAGPTGKGKTGLVGTLALSLARTGQYILWITTELDDAEQASRFAAMAMRATGTNATPDDLLGHHIPAEYGARAVDGLPLYLVNLDDPDRDAIADIRASMRQLVDEHGQTPVLIVDYLQVLATEEADRRRMSVTRVATAMRKIAREFDTPVVAISSVSRAYYGAAGKAKKAADEGRDEDPRDWLAAAKESGDIEYAAAVFGYLDTANDINQLGESDARLIVAKARAGLTGFVGLKFHGPSGLFIAESQSVANMRPERRAKSTPDTDKVLAYIRKNPGKSMRALRCSIPGLGKEKVEVALEDLQVRGLIESRPEEFADASGRMQKRQTWHPAVAPSRESNDD
jgi:replicative DNA helicase